MKLLVAADLIAVVVNLMALWKLSRILAQQVRCLRFFSAK
jgi:hypothetical protein